MEEKRLKQFTFYDLYYEALKGLSDEAAGRMAKNICKFMFSNETIVGFKPRRISEQKNLYLDVTTQGKFIAVKKSGDKSFNCDLSASEQVLFDFLCFMEFNKFRQIVNSVKDFNYKEKPLILVNFPNFLDESFDYISFLARQKLNRKIIIIRDVLCTKNDALNFI